MDGGLTAAVLVSPPLYLRTAEILSKRWGPPQILSLFASILDGCDGEVARLKLQESAFGCWLETICDYLYYLFIFVGMTIGLLRSTGNGKPI